MKIIKILISCLKKLIFIIYRSINVLLFRAGKEPEGLRREDIIYAKKLWDSAFHPDNGELMNFVGRMSFQLPGGVALITAMLTFYKLTSCTNNK